MFRMLVDTCVWLDVARDRKQIALLGVVEQMIRRRLLSLIVPRLLLDEFRRNRARIEKDSAKSLASQLKIVKDAVKRAGGNKRKTRGVLSYLDDVGHKIPILGGAAVGALDRIETMLTASAIVE